MPRRPARWPAWPPDDAGAKARARTLISVTVRGALSSAVVMHPADRPSTVGSRCRGSRSVRGQGVNLVSLARVRGQPDRATGLLYAPSARSSSQRGGTRRTCRFPTERIRPGLVRSRDVPLFSTVRPGVGRPQLARAVGRDRVVAVPRACPGGDRHARPGDELPPVRAGPLAVRAQRLYRRVRPATPRHDAGGAPRPVQLRPGDDRLRGDVPPCDDLRAAGRPDRCWSGWRLRRVPRCRRRIAEPCSDVGVTDGERLYAARYASGPRRTPFTTAPTSSRCEALPEEERFAHFSAEARVVVSEPLVELPGLWHGIPAGSAIVVGKGGVEQLPFVPRPPR